MCAIINDRTKQIFISFLAYHFLVYHAFSESSHNLPSLSLLVVYYI